jgi:hypothetical protein
MTEVVISQLWIFPCFADVHWYPAAICEKFSPAMVTFDRALVFIGGDRRAYGKTSGYADAAS